MEACKPEREGGLGVKDLRILNLSPLQSEGDTLWRKTLFGEMLYDERR